MDNQELFQDKQASDVLRNAAIAPPVELWSRIEVSLDNKKRRFFLWWFIPAIAITVAGAGLGGYYFLKPSPIANQFKEANYEKGDLKVQPYAENEIKNTDFLEENIAKAQEIKFSEAASGAVDPSILNDKSGVKNPAAAVALHSSVKGGETDESKRAKTLPGETNQSTIIEPDANSELTINKNGMAENSGQEIRAGIPVFDLIPISPAFLGAQFPVELKIKGTDLPQLKDHVASNESNFYVGLYGGTSLRNVIVSKTTPDSIRLLRPFNNRTAGVTAGYILNNKLTLTAGLSYEHTEWQAAMSRIMIVPDTDTFSNVAAGVQESDVYIINSFEGTNSMATGDIKQEILNNYQSEQGRLVHSIDRLRFSFGVGYQVSLSPRAGLHASLGVNYLHLLKENSSYIFGSYTKDFGKLPAFRKQAWEINPGLTFSYRFTKHLALSINTGYSKTLTPIYEKTSWSIGEQAWQLNGGLTWFLR